MAPKKQFKERVTIPSTSCEKAEYEKFLAICEARNLNIAEGVREAVKLFNAQNTPAVKEAVVAA